jgi:hypothetical protein
MPDLFTYTPSFVRRSPTSAALTVGIVVTKGPKKYDCEVRMEPRGEQRWAYSWVSEETTLATRAGADALKLVRIAHDAAAEFQQSSPRV